MGVCFPPNSIIAVDATMSWVMPVQINFASPCVCSSLLVLVVLHAYAERMRLATAHSWFLLLLLAFDNSCSW